MHSSLIVVACAILHAFSGVDAYVLDLTHNFNNETLQWPSSSAEFVIRHILETGGKHKWLLGDEMQGTVHAGTHMDSPLHFVENRWSIDEIPPENLIRPGIVIDVSKQSKKNIDYQIQISDIQNWISKNGKIPNKAVILFNTGRSKSYRNGGEYFGNPNFDLDDLHFPGIHPSTATWLVENTDIVGVGLDTPSLDNGPTKIFETHVILFKKNIYGLENVKDIEKLPSRGFTLYVSPMKLEGASGAPTRIFATLDGENSTLTTISSFTLIIISMVFNVVFNI